MQLNDQQREKLAAIAKSDVGVFLRSILQGYILEIKDDCVFKDLTKEAAKEAVSKLAELDNKLAVLSGAEPASPSKKMFE